MRTSHFHKAGIRLPTYAVSCRRTSESSKIWHDTEW